MKLAMREMRRRPSRFVAAASILSLIAVLLMFLGGLLDGLIRDSTGALRAQRADLVVYSSTAQQSFLRSRIPIEVRETIEATPGVAEVGGISVALLGARVPDADPRELADVAVFGYELSPRGVPPTPGPGEGYADVLLRNDGVDEGMTVLIGPARSPIRIVGFVDDTNYEGQAGLWVSSETWHAVQLANRPDNRLADDTVQALVVVSRDDRGGDARELADAIDAGTGGETESLTIDQAIDALPGVSEQRVVFNQIIGVTVAIAVIVVGLFFALLTVERMALYGVLKAMGARTSTLFSGLVIQAVAVTAVAAVIGGGLAVLLDALIPVGAVPYDLSMSRVFTSIVLLLVAAVGGSAFSLRRMLRIDPATAIGRAT
jgi:putative ABC transport system permease protein